MDHSGFDHLARRLGAGATRRAGLRTALGGLLGAGLAALAPAGESGAKKKKKKKRNTCPEPGSLCTFDWMCCGKCRDGQCCAGDHERCTKLSDCCDGYKCLLGACLHTSH